MFQIDISDTLVYADPLTANTPEIIQYWPPSKYYALDTKEDVSFTTN